MSLVAASAGAEEGAEARATARARAERGDAAFTAGRCDRAITHWKEALQAFTAPTIELRIAHCQALLGRVVEATAMLESIAKETLAPDAPAPFVQAKEQAILELPTVRARVATLRVELRARVRVDEIALDDATLPLDKLTYAVDPGRHRVLVRAGGTFSERAFEIGDGETHTVTAETSLAPAPPAPRALRNTGFVLGGIGVASLGTGALLGISALTLSKPLDAACGGDRSSCPPEEQDRIRTVKTQALLSDLLLGSGVVLVGAGALLLYLDSRAEVPAPATNIVVTAGPSGSVVYLGHTF